MESPGHPQRADRGSGQAPRGGARSGERTAERAVRAPGVERARVGPRAGHPGRPRRAAARRADAADPPQLRAGELLHPGSRALGRGRQDHPLHPVRCLDSSVARDLQPLQRHQGDPGAADLQQRPAARKNDDSLCRGHPTGRRGRDGKGGRSGIRRGIALPRSHPAGRRRDDPDVLRAADQPGGRRAAAAPLAVGAGEGRARQAGGPRQGLHRTAALPPLQSGDRPHQRDHEQLLRRDHHPAAFY